MLNHVHYDGPGDVPLLIVHGLFGSARNWNVIARTLAAERPVITVDLRNHGQSAWFDSHSYADMAADLAELIGARQMDVLGHSMGGKAAMMLALQQPACVRRLIVADIAPVSYQHDQHGPIAAMRRVDLATITSRAQAKAQMGDIAPQVADFLLQSLDLAGRRWLLNLDILARDMDQITGWPQPTGQFHGPTLFIAGAQSDYITPANHPAIAQIFPAASHTVIPNAGHWLHAENPQAFMAAVKGFLV